MEYQKPEIEMIWLNLENIICSSLDGEGSGDGENVGGDGSQPWE